MEIVPAFGWSRNLRLVNDQVELIATLDVGPRILSYRFLDRPNVLKVFEDQAGGSAETEWMSRGGHRLWVAPEDPVQTYVADNGPVAMEGFAGGRVLLTAPPEVESGLQKEIEIELDRSGSGVAIKHRLRNIGRGDEPFAAWALTVLAAGGIEIIPLPTKRPHPGHPSNARSRADFAPNQAVVLWPFFDFADDRWTFGTRYILLRQADRAPTKLGLAHREGRVGYLNGETLFVKQFDMPEARSAYPDRGCNFETFTNPEMLEMETLGPLISLPVGDSFEWSERWELHRDFEPVDLADEDSIDATIGPLLRRNG